MAAACRPCSWAEDRLGKSSKPANSNPSANARATKPPNLSQFNDRADIERPSGRRLRSAAPRNLIVPEGLVVSFGLNAVTPSFCWGQALSAAKGPELFGPFTLF